jgi:DNA-binding transcriptional MerR regulator
VTTVGTGLDLTVDELAERAGVPVRRIRFYNGRGMLPPPRLEGRTGRYDEAHLERLKLIRELQEAGFTLAAIEEHLAQVPADADAEAIRLLGALVAPAASGEPVRLTRDELDARVGRPVSDDEVATLEAATLCTATPDGGVELSPTQLAFATRLLELEAPLDALIEAGRYVEQHAAALAADLQRVFRTRIASRAATHDLAERERLRELAAALRPLTVRSFVDAYSAALRREVRAQSAAGAPPDAQP